MRKEIVLLIIFILVPLLLFGEWKFYEETTIKGKISGKISHDYIFVTSSGNLYQVSDYIYLYEYLYYPNVIVLEDDPFYKLIIEGIDESLLCKKLEGNIRTVVKVHSRGEILILDDRTLWSVPKYDQYHSGWWLPPYKVYITPDELYMINIEEGIKIWVSKLK